MKPPKSGANFKVSAKHFVSSWSNSHNTSSKAANALVSSSACKATPFISSPGSAQTTSALPSSFRRVRSDPSTRSSAPA